jgi:hypothetical protein
MRSLRAPNAPLPEHRLTAVIVQAETLTDVVFAETDAPP